MGTTRGNANYPLRESYATQRVDDDKAGTARASTHRAAPAEAAAAAVVVGLAASHPTHTGNFIPPTTPRKFQMRLVNDH